MTERQGTKNACYTFEMNLAMLSDEKLLAGLEQTVMTERKLVARVVAYLAEVERRRLELKAACPSLFEFCIPRLGMSEHEALRRMNAAPLARRFPVILELLERGEIHLSALLELRHHLTEENHVELLEEARGKTKAQVKEVVAKHFPKPDVPQRLRELPGPQGTLDLTGMPVRPREIERPRIEPLSETRYKLELTVAKEMRAKLQRAADLMSHRNPGGDLAIVLEEALNVLLAKLEKERLAKTERPRRAAAPADPGTITRAARRAVFERDGEQCSYVDAEGNRCPARAFLELEHRNPRARGGSGDPSNLCVFCRCHNRWAAEEQFGREFVAQKITQRQRRSDDAAEENESFARLEGGLRNLGFRASDVARALGVLRARDDVATLPVEQLLRDALAVLT